MFHRWWLYIIYFIHFHMFCNNVVGYVTLTEQLQQLLLVSYATIWCHRRRRCCMPRRVFSVCRIVHIVSLSLYVCMSFLCIATLLSVYCSRFILCNTNSCLFSTSYQCFPFSCPFSCYSKTYFENLVFFRFKLLNELLVYTVNFLTKNFHLLSQNTT